MKWMLGALGLASVLTMVVAVSRPTEKPVRAPAPRSPIVYAAVTSSRLDAGEWETVQQVLRLRRRALAPRRTAFYRSFAAYMGLQSLMSLRRVLPGRCAVAVVYLYDNLRDLLDAYPGEDWQPLRLLISKQPSLQACAPAAGQRPVYVS